MKKIYILILFVLILSIVAGCTQGKDNSTSATPSKTEPVDEESSPNAEISLTPDVNVLGVDYSFENNPPMGGNIAACGDKLFFINYNSIGAGLYSCGIDGKNIVPLDDDEFCGNLSYSDGWLYYTRSDGIYKVKTDGAEKTKILDKDLHYVEEGVDENEDYIKVMGMSVGKAKICYEYSDDYEQTIYLYTMNKDGTQNTKVDGIESTYGFYPIYTDGSDNFYIWDGDTLFKVSGGSCTSVRKLDNCNTIIDGQAYYIDYVKLNSIDIATGEKREIELEFEDEEAKIAEGVILFQFHNLMIFERNYEDYHKLFAYDVKNGKTYALGEAISYDYPILDSCVSDGYIVEYSYFNIYKLTITGDKLEAEKIKPEII